MRSAFAILVTKLCTYTFNIYVDTRIDDVDVYALARVWDVNIVVGCGRTEQGVDEKGRRRL
jgi:hypothetical protein